MILIQIARFGAIVTCYAEKPPERSSGEMFRQHERKTWRTFGERFADFRPSISRKIGRKKFHEKYPRQIPRTMK